MGGEGEGGLVERECGNKMTHNSLSAAAACLPEAPELRGQHRYPGWQ